MSTTWFLPVLGVAVLLLGWLFKPSRFRLPAYIRGPPPEYWLLGNQRQVVNSGAGVANRKWRDQYGYVYRFHGCFGIEYLMLNDANAIQHVLRGQTISWGLEDSLRQFLRLVTGEGIIYADGADHARQRRLLQPAFNPVFIKSLAPTFASCSSRFVKEWNRRLDKEGKDGTWDVNAYHWVELLTMESIGATAFGLKFGALEGEEHELMKAYGGLMADTFSRPTTFGILLQNLILHIPPWIISHAENLPLAAVRKLRAAKATSRQFAQELIEQKRKEISADPTMKDRDLLTILVKSGEKNEKGTVEPMPDEMIYNQLTTMFIAGFETAANTVSFALCELAQRPAVQDRLYAEVSSVLGSAADDELAEGFNANNLDNMPYLVAVVNEALRMHPAVNYGLFTATVDNVIPLSKPLKAEDGKEINSIPVHAGQRVILSFDGFNRSTVVWGHDANVFRPERWLMNDMSKVPPEDQCGGPYANVSNFGGGPKACIGWRYAMIEMEIFIAMIIRQFEISISNPDYEMWREGAFINTIPMQKDHIDLGPQVPIRVKRRTAKV
ncbi:cytochrome P450 [Dacryopinax primogenitus]|uniref:Cytochrome P450 n=1 Tax=Dacryopinax primogenitus (strain DJM 731) TaxID=1858805 RepID=M5G728_DACPD|nr:cytochrome P450 [Dacryopinax primogenitus]EJT99567.1 cytochrome P450 [Dacryopinax primogenitus]